MENNTPLNTKYEFLHGRLKYNEGCILTIVGRPGHGKTTLKDSIIENIEEYNNKQVNIIDFQLEMPPSFIIKSMLTRKGIDISNMEDVKKFYEEFKDRNEYYELHSTEYDPESVFKSADSFFSRMRKGRINIMSFDHVLMFRNRRVTIPDFMAACIELKKRYNAIILLLSQLNRNVSVAGRTKNNSDFSKINDSDIYDTDALQQYSDIVIGIDRPFLRGIRVFTKKNIEVQNDTAHIAIFKDRILNKKEEYLYKAVNSDFEFICQLDEEHVQECDFPEDKMTEEEPW